MTILQKIRGYLYYGMVKMTIHTLQYKLWGGVSIET